MPALIASVTDIERSAVVAAIRVRPGSRPQKAPPANIPCYGAVWPIRALAAMFFPDWQPNCGNPSTFCSHLFAEMIANDFTAASCSASGCLLRIGIEHGS